VPKKVMKGIYESLFLMVLTLNVKLSAPLKGLLLSKFFWLEYTKDKQRVKSKL